ncbi:MAG: N-acetylmuramoyl-L-alanine amidase [Bacteroidaceae bacterium]|nr:N-acetylmuramoyl-L-alanine amidase [Bacteroidaceae bacterium]
MKRAIFFIALVTSLLIPFRGNAYTLVIDAGHGGKDAGALGFVSKEKNINLAIALAFGKLVEQNCPDVKVIYTRKTDTFIELDQRARIANRNKADLFVSIHTNSTAAGRKGTTARGTETYTLGMHRAADNLAVAKRENSVITLESNYEERYEGFDPRSSESYIIFELMQDTHMQQSVKFAGMVQNQFSTHAGRVNKGVFQAGFLVLRNTSMPSVLIELGYINNRQEEQFLNSADGIAKMSRAIFNAFQSYYKQ